MTCLKRFSSSPVWERWLSITSLFPLLVTMRDVCCHHHLTTQRTNRFCLSHKKLLTIEEKLYWLLSSRFKNAEENMKMINYVVCLAPNFFITILIKDKIVYTIARLLNPLRGQLSLSLYWKWIADKLWGWTQPKLEQNLLRNTLLEKEEEVLLLVMELKFLWNCKVDWLRGKIQLFCKTQRPQKKDKKDI